MSLTRPNVTTPVNLSDTFSALNRAAESPSVQETVQQKTSFSAMQTHTAETAAPTEIPSRNYARTASTVTAENVHPKEEKPVNSTTKTMISLRLLKSDKEKFQEFFKAHGLSFTDGLYMAADFIEKEVRNGRLQMSKSGIQYADGTL